MPAHDRKPGDAPTTSQFGDKGETSFADEKEELRKTLEDLVGKPETERLREYRKLARRCHPDKNPEDLERATDVFQFLQDLREALLKDPREKKLDAGS